MARYNKMKVKKLYLGNDQVKSSQQNRRSTLVTATAAQINGLAGGGTVTADLVGNVTGNVTGNVAGNVTGNIDGAIVDGDTLITKTLTPVNAVAAVGTWLVSGDCIEGELVTIGADVYEVDSNGSLDNGGTIAIDVSGVATYSSGTITVDTILAAGDTITIDSVVYTMMADGTADEAGEVDVGSDLADCKVNLTAAFDGTDGYNVAHPTCSAAAWATHDWVITYDIAGVAGDLITFLSDSTEGTNSIDGGGTLGGTAAGVDATAAQTITAMVAAEVASGTELVTAADGTTEAVVTSNIAGVLGNAIAFTTAGVNMTIEGAVTVLGNTVTGVDGTVGSKGQIEWDATNIYVCILANTIADANWVQATLATY